MQALWAELAEDFHTAAIYWQLLVVVAGLATAWAINKMIRRKVMSRAPESWRLGIGGAERILFPLTSLVFTWMGSLLLRNAGMHTSLISLVSTLLVAMAIIRLAVYALRYVFAPSTWLKTTENAIVSTVWVLVALYLIGLLPEMVRLLDELRFNFGKHELSLWLILQATFMVVVTIVIALSVSRFLENKLMRAEQVDMNLRVVLSKLLRILLTLIAVLTALSAIGFDITLLSVFGGALGVGLGFGLQKIASNYVSGFIILLDESVHLNDVVTIDTHYGVVDQIRSRYLVLRKLDGTEVVIPNETLISQPVINHSFTDRKARVNLPLQVSYEGDLEQAMALMRQAAVDHPRVMKDPSPDVQLTGFGENGIDLQVTFWIPDPEEGSAGLKSELYLAIWRSFQRHGVTIPYPQRDIRIISAPPPTAAGN